MKTAVSIPDALYAAAEAAAKQLGLSRSALYARALRGYLARHRERDITERLNAVYAGEPRREDPFLRAALYDLWVRHAEPEEW